MTWLVQFTRLAAAALILWLGALSHGLGAELDSTAVLAKNGELTVTERIHVHGEGTNEYKNSFFRDIPLIVEDARHHNNKRTVSFTLLEVTRDGKPEPFHIQYYSDSLRLYVGENAWVKPADRTYVIRYRTGRQVLWVDDKQELHWKMTGSFSPIEIKAANYRLELADKMRPTRWGAFLSLWTGRRADATGAIDADGALTVSTKQWYSEVTVVVDLPDGAVTAPTPTDKFLSQQPPTAEVIHSFDSTIVLAKDGELTVTERIHTERSSIKHGLVRDFPLTFADAQGKRHEVPFTVLDVTRDGKPEPYFSERVRGDTDVQRVYVGDKNVELQPGEYTYVIRYRTARQVRWFDGKPELNWNVTGNFTLFPTLAASYRLELADKMRPTRWTAFTGLSGVHGADWRGAIGNDGALTVSTTRPLAMNEGLTVDAALPDGAVAPSALADNLQSSFIDNRAWIFSGIGFVLVFFYYRNAWKAVGRNATHGTIIPLFHPPKDISAPLASYIEDWSSGFRALTVAASWQAFTAAALSLAAQGLVRFDNRGGALTLKARGVAPKGGTPLATGEGAILTKLNAMGGTLVIDQKNGRAVAEIRDEFGTAMNLPENKKRFFRRNLGYVIVGALMTAAVLLGVWTYGGLSAKDIVAFQFLRLCAPWIGLALILIIVRAWLMLIGLSLLAPMVLLTLIGGPVPLLNLVQGHPLPFVFASSFTVLNGLFFYLLTHAPTALGRSILDQLAGFKLYLQTAESDRLNLQVPEITAERFEALLPYAVALNVEKPWSDAFAAALKRAHPEDAEPMSHYQPTWTDSSWSSSNFGSSIASTVASTSSALSTSVSDSSSSSSGFSSGGGGSGSGGGGGGTGSW